MCIAIYKPEAIELLPETLKNCWNANPDGAGFMFSKNKKLVVIKGLMNFETFLETYEEHKSKECILHFRIRTHGASDAYNTHPFLIDENLGMVHNGIMSNICTKSDQTKSDTWHFTETHLAQFRKDNPLFFLNPHYKDIIESFIGYSKLIFMDNLGNVEIFNESKGFWNSKCWFSNSSWETPKYQTQVYQPRNKPHYKKPDPSSNLKLEDLCQLEYAIGMGKTLIAKDSYVTVKSFGLGISVYVEEILSGITGFTTLANLVKLDDRKPQEIRKGDVYKLTQNYNHFRIGDSVVCIGNVLSNGKILVKSEFDMPKDTPYWIRQDFLELVQTSIIPVEKPALLTYQDSEFLLDKDKYHIWD